MPEIAGSTPVARRGLSVMKTVSCVTCRSNLKARRIFHFEIMEGAHIFFWGGVKKINALIINYDGTVKPDQSQNV